jgi:DNA-binding HxlR family transcriptional regulator
VRSGAQTLALLAAPLNVSILRALADGPKQQSELQRVTDSPAQTTLRAQLKRLVAIGAIEKHRRNRFPGVLEYSSTASGRDLFETVHVLERWLGDNPDGPLTLDSNAARAAIRALAEGWSTTLLRALAAGPLSLTQLDGVIGSLSYPALERRLGAMRLAGLLETRRGSGRGTPYAVTDWLRAGVAPIAAAIRWERRHLAQSAAPIGRLDIETIFLLAAPLLHPPAERSGTCRMAAQISNGEKSRLAGVTVDVRGGRVVACSTQLQGAPDAWALGSPTAWLDAVLEQDTTRLELGGDCSLARALVDVLYGSLSRERIRDRP